MAYGQHYPDPGETHGAFRVLPRTDGGYVIQDTRRALGSQTVGKKFKKLEDAVRTAKAWHEQGHG